MKIFFEYKKNEIFLSEIAPFAMIIESKPLNVRDLIISLVKKSVCDFNRKNISSIEDSNEGLENYSIKDLNVYNLYNSGKIAFGLHYNTTNADPTESIETALQGYKDGLYKLFINHNLLGDLNNNIEIKDGDLVSAIRLTFLSGRLW